MAIGDVLKNFRQGDYGAKPKEGPSQDAPTGGPRSFKLTEDEVKGVGSYQPGGEVECLVKGRLGEDGTLTITSVSPAGGGGMDEEKEMAAQMMGKEPPMMQNRVNPSPS